MPLRSLFKYLADNEKLVQKLAESYPIRRAAQLAISVFYRSKEKLTEIDPQQVNRLTSFFKKFTQNVRQEIEEAKKKIKK